MYSPTFRLKPNDGNRYFGEKPTPDAAQHCGHAELRTAASLRRAIRPFVIVWVALLSISCGKAPEFEKVTLEDPDTSNLYINDGASTELCYLKLVPESAPIGAVVIFPSGGEAVQDVLDQVDIPRMACDEGILTIIPSMNWGTEQRDAEIKVLNKIFEEVVTKHGVPSENFVLGGLSNGGMISLTYAIRSVREKEAAYLTPKGVFGLDVPLDKTRMYEYCQREIDRGFSEVGVNEARWMLNNFNQVHGGSPREFPERYIEASIYSHGAEGGGNTRFLKDIAVRMYTDLDVEWMVNDRGRDLYDWNGTDVVGMVNQLKLSGSRNAEVLISTGEGFRPDGTRHPHSWSILDDEDLMKWMLELFDRDR